MSKQKKKSDFFYYPTLNAYEFLRVFIRVSKLANISSFKPNELESFIIQCKEHNLFEDLLEAIDFECAGDIKFSLNFRRAIIEANFSDLLYVVPSKSKEIHHIIFCDEYDFIHEKEFYFESMEEFVNLFNTVKSYDETLEESNENTCEVNSTFRK